MKYFKLPDLGEGLIEADIVEWLVKEGDQVQVDQIIISVETAKAIIQLPSPQNGTISHLFGQAGDTIHTGEPLLEFAGEKEESTTVVGEIPQTQKEMPNEQFIIGAAPSSQIQASNTQSTPAVRALAARLNVDLTKIRGTGHHGLITPSDIESAALLEQSHGKAEPLKGVRKQMAKIMSLSHAEVVPVTIHEDIDIHNWSLDEDVTMRLIQAIAKACKDEPSLNVWFDGHNLSKRQHELIDLGVAVDTDHGLFVPVLRDIGNRSIADLRKGLNQLRKDVKNRQIPPQELKGATITLSNFGMIAGRYANPIIVPPQVAILGAGKIRKQVVPFNNEVATHNILPLSLTFDHRALAGGDAARFLKSLITSLEN